MRCLSRKFHNRNAIATEVSQNFITDIAYHEYRSPHFPPITSYILDALTDHPDVWRQDGLFRDLR